ncbi:hypothetical protein B9Z55_007458 [Caenorhabditis nigoni]|nr:hypothetical protein B9Z55_007458 [Caenorhabditis nigoni]
MRTSSTNIILLAIAISNLVYMAYHIMDWMKKAYENTKTCVLPDSYAYVLFNWIYNVLQDDARRCDAFMGLAMASIRTCVLKFPVRSRTAASVSFGWKNCLIALLFSSIFSLAYLLAQQIVLVDYTEFEECYEQFPNETFFEVYTTMPSTLAELNGFLYFKLYMVLNAIFSKIIPAVLFPILTILLIVELRKIEESRNRMFSNSNQNK